MPTPPDLSSRCHLSEFLLYLAMRRLISTFRRNSAGKLGFGRYTIYELQQQAIDQLPRNGTENTCKGECTPRQNVVVQNQLIPLLDTNLY